MAILVAALRPARYPCQTRLLASISARTSSRPISLRRRRDRCARARARPGPQPRRRRQLPCEPGRRCRRRAAIRTDAKLSEQVMPGDAVATTIVRCVNRCTYFLAKRLRCACFQLPKDSPSRSGPLRGSLSHRRAEARRDWRPPSSSHDSVRQAPSALSTTLSASRRRSYTNTSAFCSGDRGDWKRCHSSRSY